MITLTAFSKKKNRGRTEVDIATQYLAEEEEKTKKIVEMKKHKNASDKESESSFSKPRVEKKVTHQEKSIIIKSKSSTNKSSTLKDHSKGKPSKRRSLVKKIRKNRRRIKNTRNQYFQRYNV